MFLRVLDFTEGRDVHECRRGLVPALAGRTGRAALPGRAGRAAGRERKDHRHGQDGCDQRFQAFLHRIPPEKKECRFRAVREHRSLPPRAL